RGLRPCGVSFWPAKGTGATKGVSSAGTASFAEAGLSPLTRRSVSLQRSQALETIHIGTKRAGDRHGAVGVLIVLEYGGQSPSHGEARAIQRVAVVSFAATGWAIPDFGSARLVRLAVRARRDLAVLALPRQPHFQVVRLGGRLSHVARAELDDAVREF